MGDIVNSVLRSGVIKSDIGYSYYIDTRGEIGFLKTSHTTTPLMIH